MVNETAVCFVMVSWIAWPTVGRGCKSHKKVFLLQKEAGQLYDFFGVADRPTLCNLCSYFVLNHIIDTYNIYMNMVIYPVNPVHLSYDCHYYKLSFTGALIGLFGCSSILFESFWISVLF